jgi:hypothetical protein
MSERAYRELGEGDVVVVEGGEEEDVLPRDDVVRLEATHVDVVRAWKRSSSSCVTSVTTLYQTQ